MTTDPMVSVVICTRDRPILLRRAIDAIWAQTVADIVETIVVFDRCEPDASLEVAGGRRPVRVAPNSRTPGLAGGRNTGVDLARAAVVAFCDDDDVWFPEKVARQIAVLTARPDVDVVVSGVRIEVDGRRVERALNLEEVTFADLLRSRVMQAHPSTVMFRRDAFVKRFGGIDEQIPGGYGEDYEWLLRAARYQPIAVVPEPLVSVEWHDQSYFAARWQTRADALEYLLDRYPEFGSLPRGLARIRGQRSFALAALGRRRDAWREIQHTLKQSWREPRAYLAGVVASGLVPSATVVRILNRRGHGI